MNHHHILAGAAAAVVWLATGHPAFAQAHNPFGVGISEGGGSASGLAGWLLAEQAQFERQLSAAVRATRTDGTALWWLTGLSFVYGVFHAAGPGHGKAVMTSYLFANERALRRGLVLSLLAALLQGCVAIGLVGVLALVLHATAAAMKAAASDVEIISYAGVATLGAWLVWQKGRRLAAELRLSPGRPWTLPFAASSTLAVAAGEAAAFRDPPSYAHRAATSGTPSQTLYALGVDCGCAVRSAFVADPGHRLDCGHAHAPDPAQLAGENFSWREAALTVVAAGARPCSGAILVLVFALAQGLFGIGVAAVGAMAAGTAITTGALAALAVLAKRVAVRFLDRGSRRGTLILRAAELLAAVVILVVGLALVVGATAPGFA